MTVLGSLLKTPCTKAGVVFDKLDPCFETQGRKAAHACFLLSHRKKRSTDTPPLVARQHGELADVEAVRLRPAANPKPRANANIRASVFNGRLNPSMTLGQVYNRSGREDVRDRFFSKVSIRYHRASPYGPDIMTLQEPKPCR